MNTDRPKKGEKMKSRHMAPHIPIPKEPFKSITEGRALLRITYDKVFYNPVQEFNRDLSILVLTVFIEDFKKQVLLKAKKVTEIDADNEDGMEKVDITILEALSATGLRSIRYAKELVDVTKIVANDISERAVKTINDNICFNNVDHIVETSHDDACLLMQKHKLPKKRFTAVDLDPYGSPSLFLDGAVQCVAEGGMLLVTATDMAVLAGNSPETCYAKYGAMSLKTKCCHEMALRILLQSIQSHANRHNRYIVPMLSVSADFYIRVFVKVYSGAGMCKHTPSKLSMVFQCVGCDSITLQPLGGLKPIPNKPNRLKTHMPTAPPVTSICEHCGHRHQMGGPIWSGPLHDKEFVMRALDLVCGSASELSTARRLHGVLSVISEEVPAPLYQTLDRLCSAVQSEMIPIMLIRSALLHAGYEVSYSHANKLSIKTNAPNKLLWDIMRVWKISQPVRADKLDRNPLTKHILSQPTTFEVVLAQREDANPESRREKRKRFQFNPAPNWGPGCRSTVNISDTKNLKAIQNQNKRTAKWNRRTKKRYAEQEDDEVGENLKQQALIINTTTSEADSDVSADMVDDLDGAQAAIAVDVITKPTDGAHSANICSTEDKVVEAPEPGISEDAPDAKQ